MFGQVRKRRTRAEEASIETFFENNKRETIMSNKTEKKGEKEKTLFCAKIDSSSLVRKGEVKSHQSLAQHSQTNKKKKKNERKKRKKEKKKKKFKETGKTASSSECM
jgi:hypothetical protein